MNRTPARQPRDDLTTDKETDNITADKQTYDLTMHNQRTILTTATTDKKKDNQANKMNHETYQTLTLLDRRQGADDKYALRYIFPCLPF